jgi:predicted enzyme related to lactoylglutathione lyase
MEPDMQQLDAKSKTDPADVVGMDMAAYFTNDPSASIAFYRDVLGITPTAVDTDGHGAEFTLADGTTFGVWNDENTKAPGGTIMFAVGDINAAVARLRARGLEIADPMETPVCFMTFATDPDGNPFMVHQRKQ